MNKKIERNYLEINSLSDLKESSEAPKNCSIELLQPVNFQLNKFFYKNVGKKHHWVDRLVWSDNQWINYVSNEKVKTYILNEEEINYIDDKRKSTNWYNIANEFCKINDHNIFNPNHKFYTWDDVWETINKNNNQ